MYLQPLVHVRTSTASAACVGEAAKSVTMSPERVSTPELVPTCWLVSEPEWSTVTSNPPSAVGVAQAMALPAKAGPTGLGW